MAKAIGSTFPDELLAAGLLGLPFSWDAEGQFTFSEDMSQSQIDAVLAVYEAHDPMKGARLLKINQLRGACQAMIMRGVTSDALGAPHTYPMQPADQLNMTASVVDALLDRPADWTTPFQCADAAGVWALREHTAAQIKQAGSDLKAYIVVQERKLQTLSIEAASAATQEELDAIIWS
jgi:hypothetical protein